MKKLLQICCSITVFLPFVIFAQTNVLISTDVANGLVSHKQPTRKYDTDDGIAILDLANQKQFHIAALVIQFGNTDADREYKIAQDLVKIKGLHVPVIKGALGPLKKTGAVPVTPGARYMAKYLQHHKAIIMGIAPLTDIASLLVNFPKVRHNILHIYVEVGRIKPRVLELGPNHKPVLGMNYVRDTRAAYLVVNSQVPVTMLSFGAVSTVMLVPKDFRHIAANNTPAAKWLAATLFPWFDYWRARFDEKGIHPWDAVVSYYLVSQQGFHCQMLPNAIIPSNYSKAFLKKNPIMREESTWLVFGRQFTGEKQEYCAGVSAPVIEKMRRWIIANAY